MRRCSCRTSWSRGAAVSSLRLVPAWEQILQGVKLRGFYVACNIVPNDPIKSLFAVSFAPITAWSCGGP